MAAVQLTRSSGGVSGLLRQRRSLMMCMPDVRALHLLFLMLSMSMNKMDKMEWKLTIKESGADEALVLEDEALEKE